MQNSYFAFGQYDAVLITEMPDNVSAAAIALAFAAGRFPAQLPDHSADVQRREFGGHAQSRDLRL